MSVRRFKKCALPTFLIPCVGFFALSSVHAAKSLEESKSTAQKGDKEAVVETQNLLPMREAGIKKDVDEILDQIRKGKAAEAGSTFTWNVRNRNLNGIVGFQRWARGNYDEAVDVGGEIIGELSGMMSSKGQSQELKRGIETFLASVRSAGAYYAQLVEKYRRDGGRPQEGKYDVRLIATPANTRLLEAAKTGDAESVGKCLAEGAFVDFQNTDGWHEINWTPLMLASLKGHVSVARLLLDKGAQANHRAAHDWTPLMSAALNGHAEIVRALLEKGAKADSKCDQGESSLHWAAAQGHVEAVSLLLRSGATINAQSNLGSTPLLLAAGHGGSPTGRRTASALDEVVSSEAVKSGKAHAKVVELLLAKGADVTIRDHRGQSALLLATFAREPATVKLLLERGCDANAADEFGLTPLWWAGNDFESVKLLLNAGANANAVPRYESCSPPLHGADLETAKLLLKKGAKVDAPDRYGKTALMKAAEQGDLQVTELLLESGADPNGVDSAGRPVLMPATAKGHTEVAKLLIEKGADVNARDSDDNTALMYACINGRTPCAELLIQKGANVNTRGQQGRPALTLACAKGHTDCANLLVQHGARLNAQDDDGTAALHEACTWGRTDCVKLLVRQGANVDVRNRSDKTPLMLVAGSPEKAFVEVRKEAINVAKVLIEGKADVNAKDSLKRTALIRCCEYPLADPDRAKFAKLLIENRAIVDAMDWFGRTALMYACQRRSPGCVQVLIQHGANVNIRDGEGKSPLQLLASAREEYRKALEEEGVKEEPEKEAWGPQIEAMLRKAGAKE